MQLPGRRINQGENLYTPWFSRGGDSMLLRIETLKAVHTGGSLSVKVETKNEDDPTGATAMTFTAGGTTLTLATSAGDFVTGLCLSKSDGSEGTKQQVRLAFSWSGGASTDYVDVRVLAPVFFDAAKVN